ncbi:MAG: cytochrome c3 family protein [Myxococcaceae bacterium]
MARTYRGVAVALVALLAGAGIAWAASGRERSLAVYPAQVIPLEFDHDLHIKAGADCTACHFDATKSNESRDRILPAHPECEECHDISAAEKGEKTDPAASCEVCHVGFDKTVRKEPAAVVFLAPNLRFPHGVHTKDHKIECKTCHGDFDGVHLATRQQLPKMATCLTCHDGRQASAECKTCHLTEPSGRLDLTFASGLLRPMQGDPWGMDHGPRFEFNHGTQASTREEVCLECHARSECNECHDSLQKPLSVHPNDFITLHPIQARQNTMQCQSCHRYQSFCVACHERTGVALTNDRFLDNRNVRVHPPTAVWVDTPGPQHHGIAASRNINECVACHREESCLSCHSESGRFGIRRQVNPHPTGFETICKAVALRNDRACLKCHTQDSASLQRCR